MNLAQQFANDSEVADALSSCSAEVRDGLEAALASQELTFDAALPLAQATASDLRALILVAERFRRESVGVTITYVVNRNINFTNVCFVGCSFCGFARGPQANDAYSLSTAEVVRRAE